MKNSSSSRVSIHPHVEMAIELFQSEFAKCPSSTVGDLLNRYAERLLTGFIDRNPLLFILMRNWIPEAQFADEEEFHKSLFVGNDARQLAAKEHGFCDWAHAMECANHPIDAGFDQAVDAVIRGQLKPLEQLLQERPNLISQRSHFGHRASLLHYIAANGVETRHQIAPPNATQVTQMLLQAGADPDALADTYGGGTAQTPICLLVTSAHPAQCGTTSELLQTLVEGGAKIEGVEGDGLPLYTASHFGNRESIDTLVRLGATITDIGTASATGNVELMQHILDSGEQTSPLDLGSPPPKQPQQKIPIGNESTFDLMQTVRVAIDIARRHGRQDMVRFLTKLRSDYDDALDDFDAAWNENQDPELSEHIPPSIRGMSARRLLLDLVNIDLEYRWRSEDRSTTDIDASDLKPDDHSALQLRPLLEDYAARFPILAPAEELPLWLILEEFRIRHEIHDEPEVAEYLSRFPSQHESLQHALMLFLEEDQANLRTLQLEIYHQHSRVYSTPFEGRVEIGRQRPDEPEPYCMLSQSGTSRLIIASLKERFLSRAHLELELLKDGRILATNRSTKNAISMPMHLRSLPPGKSQEVQAPVEFSVQSKTIRVSETS